MRRRRHLRQHIILPPTSLTSISILFIILIRGRGLRVQDKRDREQAFDPFDELVPSVRLEGVFDAVAGRHCLIGLDWVRGNGGYGVKGGREGRESGRIVEGKRERGWVGGVAPGYSSGWASRVPGVRYGTH